MRNRSRKRAVSFVCPLVWFLLLLFTVGCGPNALTETDAAETAGKTWKGEKIMNFNNIQQQPELPSGCEITSAAMVLNYFGCGVSKMELADYFPIGGMPHPSGGRMVGPNPWKVFAGSPTDSGYGCYAPVVTQAVNRYVTSAGRNLKAVNLSGTETSGLIPFIDAGIPVIVWATISMKEPYAGDGWVLEDTGEAFRWLAREHCLVLIGYSGNDVVLSDPLDRRGTVRYDFALFEKRYRQLSCQAVVVE
jgi:uncharacterized protein YvpB